jgi:hypothetical protein
MRVVVTFIASVDLYFPLHTFDQVVMNRYLSFPILLSLVITWPVTSPLLAQQGSDTAMEWMFSDAPGKIDRTPQTFWTSDGSLLLYDTLGNRPEGVFCLFDPVTGRFSTACDVARALESLRQIAGVQLASSTLPWSDAFDAAGRKAVYLFGGDVFLLELDSSRFARITNTEEEESCATISPDGRRIAYVRGNDLYMYDTRGGTERRLTLDGSDSTLNGKFSGTETPPTGGLRTRALLRSFTPTNQASGPWSSQTLNRISLGFSRSATRRRGRRRPLSASDSFRPGEATRYG